MILITSQSHSELKILPGFLHTGTVYSLEDIILFFAAKMTTWTDLKSEKKNSKNHQMEKDSTETESIYKIFCHKATSDIGEK